MSGQGEGYFMGEALSTEPRSPSQLVGVSRRLWIAHLADLAKLYAVFLLPVAGLGILLLFAMSEAIVELDGRWVLLFASESDLNQWRIYSFILVFAEVAAGFVASGAAVLLLSERSFGRTITWSEALRTAWSRIGALLFVALLSMVGVLIGFFFLVIPGVYLAIAWWVWPVAVMVEGKRGQEALRRSRQLVSGRWWATFGAGLLAGLLAIVITVGIGIGIELLPLGSPESEVALGSLLGSVSNAFVAPLFAAVMVVMYYDLRSREAIQTSGVTEDSPLPPPLPPEPTEPYVETAYVPAEGLFVRSEPDAEIEPELRLGAGTEVTVIEYRGTWAKVRVVETEAEYWLDGDRLTVE